MVFETADVIALRGLLYAQLLMLVVPGANQLALCCASSVSLRAGLRGALVLAAVACVLTSLSVVFGQAVAEQDWLVERWLGAGALYLAFTGARRLAAAARGRCPDGHRHSDWLNVAVTALSNPFSLVFYASMVVPVTASRDGELFAVAVVVAMTGVAAAVYLAFALAFACPSLRRGIQANRRATDAVVGLCLLLLATRMSLHLLPA